MRSETLDFVLWTMVLVLLHSNSVVTKDHFGYYAAYVCDGKMLKIECKEGYVINLIRANYGRYSIAVCNDNGSTDWSVNCMSHRSFNILQGRCGLKRNCSVPASTSLFDDPCPGTVKYLEAHYACISATASSSTARPTPPWLMTSPPSVWMTAKSFTVHSDIVVPSTSSTSPTASASSISTVKGEPHDPQSEENNEWIPPSNMSPPLIETSSENEFILPPSTNTETQSTSTEAPILSENSQLPLCKPVVVRGLTWNWTVAGDVSVQPCPGGASGFARYRCHKIDDNLAIRFPDMPDLSECRSVWLNTLERGVNEGESLIKIATDLCQVTESKPLYGGDMLTAAKIIRDLAHKMSKDVQTFPDQRQREAIVYDLLQSVAVVGSNMLDVSKHPSWQDLSLKEQMRVATSLLVGLEENSFLLAETFVREKVVTHCTENMILSVQVLEVRNVGNEVFPTHSVLENCSLRVNNWLQLQRSSLLENNVSGLVRLVYIAFDTLEYVLKVQPYGKEEKKINSKVLSASLGKGRHIQLTQPVTLCLQHLQTENVSNPTCVFWDYTQSIWSEEGCTLISTNETHSICQCNHLTNFAILVDVKPTYSTRQVSIAVSIMLVIAVLVLAVIALVLIVKFVRKHNTRKDYGSSFIQESEWFTKCFGCCQSSAETEKTLNCKDPRPALYGNPTMQSMTSMDNEGATICTTHITHPSNTIPRSYAINDNGGVENHYPGSHIRLNHNYPTSYRSNGSLRKIKEARRLEHLEHLENTLHRNKKLAGTLRSNSPRSSHTYSEIAAGSSRNDPVYEEIEREREHCSQISDVSDEDAKRQSDMSRQSSKSYGDHRPLIPYNPVSEYAAYRQQLREHGSARTISVLDGQTVICHLAQQSDPRIYQKTVSHSPHHY